MKKKTLSIGGATYDLFVRTANNVIQECGNQTGFFLELGEKKRVEDVIETCGGGASNTSVGLSRLGCDASYCGVIGDDQWGEKLIENFKKEGVDTGCITIVEDEVSSFSIILSASDGERVILYSSGTNEHLHDANFARDTLLDVDWVYFNHIQAQSCVIQDDIIEMLTQDKSPRLSWNPGGCQIEMGLEAPNNRLLLAHTDLLLLNESEARLCTNETTTIDALKRLIDAGTAHVCITRGSKGVIASDGESLFESAALSDVECIDTTGAGDAFGTGVTWALLNDYTLKEALKAGTINGARVTEHIGAQAGLLTETDMHIALEQTQLDVSVQSL